MSCREEVATVHGGKARASEVIRDLTRVFTSFVRILNSSHPRTSISHTPTSKMADANGLSEVEKVYDNLYKIMMEHFQAEQFEQSTTIAQALLKFDDLSAFVQLRCFLVVATGGSRAIVTWR